MFFGRIRKQICDLRSFGSCRIKGTDKSLSRVDSSVPLMWHDPNALRSQIRFRILPQKCTLSLKVHSPKELAGFINEPAEVFLSYIPVDVLLACESLTLMLTEANKTCHLKNINICYFNKSLHPHSFLLLHHV